MAIAKNTSHYLGMEGMVEYGCTISKRWIDALTESAAQPEEEEDNRTCEQVASDIWSRIRGH